jgi:integrase
MRLLDALEPKARALATGALYTGCRVGELLALRAADVADGRVHVRHSKSGRARHVPLSKPGRAFFAQQTADKAPDALIFGIVDTPSERVALSRKMRAACVAAKIAPAVRFHDLRRSYGSLMLNNGAPMEALKDLLGHADMRMTARVYAHMGDETLQRTVDQHLPSFTTQPTRKRRRSVRA